MASGSVNRKTALSQWVIGPVVCVCLVLAAGGARSADNSVVTEQTESFLGDSSSVGALVGGILAGASFANPFAPLGGTIIGFFVGKSTDFSEKEEANNRFAQRSFAPVSNDSGGDVRALALSGDNSSDGDVLVFADDPLVGNGAEHSQTSAVSGDSGGANGGGEMAVVDEDGSPNDVEPPVNLIITKQVGREQEKLDELAATIREEQNRPEFTPSQRCPERDAPRYRKKLAVAGFTMERPEQAVLGGLSEAGPVVSKMLYQRFQQSGKVLPYSAPRWQMYASLDSAPTVRVDTTTNRLSKYSAVSREMGAQFVVSGVIRSVAVRDPGSWDTSTYSQAKRKLLGADDLRSFVLDVVVHDGYTGHVVMEKRYQTHGAWDVGRYENVGFDSARFSETGYGQSVEALLTEVSTEVAERVACQPMLVPILEVNQQDMVLDVGTNSGLLPGDKLKVVRAQSSWADLNAPPRLIDTGVELHIHSLSLDKAQAWMPEQGEMINIQQGDYAVIY